MRWILAAVLAIGLVFGATAARAAVTERVSVSTAGDEANGDSGSVRVTPDGRLAVFQSLASNLVADDTNDVCDKNGDNAFDQNCQDIFVRDLLNHTTTRASLGTGGVQASASSTNLGVSDDGR